MWLSKSQDFDRFTLSVYRHDSWIQIKVNWAAKSHFRYIKIQHDSDTWRTQSKWVMFIHFLCLCPLPKTLNKHVYQFSLFVSSKSRHHAELHYIESGLFWKTLFRIRHPFYRWGALCNENICVQGYTFIVQRAIDLIHVSVITARA